MNGTVKMRVPAQYGAFWYPDPANPGKDLEAKAGDLIDVPERIARLYGWSPEALQKEADELAKQAAEAQAMADAARASAEAAKKAAAEAEKTAKAGAASGSTSGSSTLTATSGKGK